MEFRQKDIKRAVRDFRLKINNLLNADHSTYKTRTAEFINEIENNEVLETIVGPYLSMYVDFFENQDNSSTLKFMLPTNKELQIAYVLQILRTYVTNNINLEMFAFSIFRQKRISDNLYYWNQQIVSPVAEVLLLKLDDLVEDEIEGKDKIPEASLQIINYGSITAEQGNVAIGQHIKQSIEKSNISKSIVDKALKEEVISDEQVPQLTEITNQIEIELNKENPSETLLKTLINKLYVLGEKALIRVTTQLINFPVWTSAVNDFLLQL